MPGENIDVNVHPTKLEVHFLHDEKVLEILQRAFDAKLAPKSDERVMKVAPCFLNNHESTIVELDSSTTEKDSSKIYPKEKIRHDKNSQKIDTFLQRIDNIRNSNNTIRTSFTSDESNTSKMSIEPRKSIKRKIDQNETVTGIRKRQKLNLESMNQLYREEMENADQELKHMLAKGY